MQSSMMIHTLDTCVNLSIHIHKVKELLEKDELCEKRLKQTRYENG